MSSIFQTTFSNAFSWMKMYEFQLRFQLSLSLRIQLTIIQYWFRWWLGASQATSHCLNQWWLVYWCIFGSVRLNELSHRCDLFQCLGWDGQQLWRRLQNMHFDIPYTLASDGPPLYWRQCPTRLWSRKGRVMFLVGSTAFRERWWPK